MEDWFIIDVKHVQVDRMIKVMVVLECEFESARGSAMLLAMVAKPIESLDFF